MISTKQVTKAKMKLLQKLDRLNHYTKSIVAQADLTGNHLDCRSELIYLVSNLSIYAFRQERGKLAEV